MLNREQIIEITIAIAGSIVLGWLVKGLIFPYLYKLTRKTKWKSDDLVIDSIGKWVIFWFFLGACYYVLPIFTTEYPIVNKYESILEDLLGSLFIFSLTVVFAKVIAGMLKIRSVNDNSEIPSSSILGNIVKIIIYILGFILILHNFGVAIAPMVTALGVGGLAVALALQSTLSNLFSGLQIIASGKFNIGDFVQLETGQKGFIRDITWRNATIETAQNNFIIVPNSKLADSIVENFYLVNKETTYFVIVGVGYESDLEKVERVSVEVAKDILRKVEGGVKDFEPQVRFFNFGDSSIGLKIFLRVNEYADQFMITSEFIKALQKRYKAEGINIPFPIRTVHLNK
jgi:small-conductance mechanosensitive channel